jgi:hypothetical protein
MIKDDCEAWKKYPQHHNWFNKLWVSEKLGHKCGPCGTTPDKSGYYIVRPTYNLSGMGVGAEYKYLTPDDYSQVPPGYFWQEIFLGKHYSAQYEFVHDAPPYWKPINCFKGLRLLPDLWKFDKWVRSDYVPEVPRVFNELSDVKRINIEFKGDVPIEVHLRDSPDPEYDEFIPIWEGMQKEIDKYINMGYSYIESFDDADGFLHTPRLGFVVKNKGDINE